MTVHARTFELIKGEHTDTIYYVDDDTMRHTFPNRTTYQSWYGDDFSRVVTVNSDVLSAMPLGKNVTMRSGYALVKIPSSKEVYAVEPGGLLRHITDVSFAENLYGDAWEDLIVDVPEVFFGDYTIGRDISKISDIPDGVLYKLSGEEQLYWKDRNVLQRFSGKGAVIANGLNPNTPFVNSQAFFTRDSIVSGRDSTIFNPVKKPFVSGQDCSVKEVRTGFIYLYKGAINDDDVEIVQRFKEGFPEFWNFITRDLSSIDTSFPLRIVPDSDLFSTIDEDNGGFTIKNELLFEFYESSPDTFDTIFVFTNFSIGKGNTAFYAPITNAVNGIGKVTLDRSSLFGSQGKLKGVMVMGNIGNYSRDTKRLEESAFERMSHELLHLWSGALTFTDENGQVNKSLLTEDGIHWSPWVTFVSPLGGLGWKDQGGGLFLKDEMLKNTFRRPLPEIDLYAMGLIPVPFVSDVHYLDAVGIEPLTDSFTGTSKKVTIEQIIDAVGKRSCWAR